MRDNTASDGERRWTAVMLVDMAGSSAVTAEIGAEKAYQMMAQLIGYAVAAVERHGGTALTFGGDSLLASFGAPVACEDASLKACRAALEFQAKLHARKDAIKRRFGVVPVFRVGVSGGTVVVGHMGPSAGMDLNIMGQPVNTASRLQEMAKPGQILLSDSIFEQVEGEVECHPLGPQTLKGIADKISVYALTSLADTAGRFAGRVRRGLVTLVGRTAPREALIGVMTGRKPGWHVALLKGAPGIGKSRLLHDTYSQLRSEKRFFIGQCRSGNQAPFRPITEILIAASGQRPDAPPDDILRTLHETLGDIDLTAFGDLLTPRREMGFDSAESNFATALRQTLSAALIRLCERAPTVLVIEDMHWIDGPSQALISDLLTQAPATPSAFLMTSRPEGAKSWETDRNTRVITLGPLNRNETAELARRRIGIVALAPEFSQLLFQKSEGNPLFAEEILRYLGATDALLETADGMALRPGKGDHLAQGNLQHLVMARVDRLAPALRQLLRYAAVVGRQFSQDVLHQINPGFAVAEALNLAAARGLVERDRSGGDGTWRFTHALLHDAIYGSLLQDSLIPMHGVVGHALETVHSGRRGEFSETLASHFLLAQEDRRAAPYLVMAAHKALQIYDLSEVDRILSRVIDMLDDDPGLLSQKEFDAMAVDWLEAMLFKGNFARVIALGDRLLPRLREAGNPTAAEIATSHVATALTHTRDYPAAIALAQQGIAEAKARGDALGAAWLHLPLLRAYEETDALPPDAFQALAEKVLLSARRHGATRIVMQVLYLQGANFRSHGLIQGARERSMALRRFAAEQNDMRAFGFACWSDALMLIVADEVEAAVALTEQGLAMTVPDTADQHVILSLWCSAMVMTAAPARADQALDKVIAVSRAYGDRNLIEGMSVIQAVLLLRTGKLTQGWNQLCAALALIDSGGHHGFSCYFHLLRAEILLTIGGAVKTPRLDSGAPDRRTTPALRPGLKDLATLISLRLSYRKLARQDIAWFRAKFKGNGTGATEARALVCEALLTRNKTKRSSMLAHACQLAKDEDLPNLTLKIDAQLG